MYDLFFFISDAEVGNVLQEIAQSQGVDTSLPASVYVGRDTR